MIWRGRPLESYAAQTSRDDCARAYSLFCDKVAVLWPKMSIRDIATELDCSVNSVITAAMKAGFKLRPIARNP
jgi:hypothetical protein